MRTLLMLVFCLYSLNSWADDVETIETADDVESVDEIETVTPVASGPAAWWGNDRAGIDRAVTLHMPHVSRHRALRLIIDHRTSQPISENPWHDYLGFDAGGLKIGLGLRFSPLNRLDVGVYRLNNAGQRFDVYQADAKVQLLQQRMRQFVDLALRGGLSWFSQQDAEDSLGFWGQLLISQRLAHRITLASGLLYHSDSTNGIKSDIDKSWSIAAMASVDVRLLSWFSMAAEAAFNVGGYGTRDKVDAAGKEVTSFPHLAMAYRFITWRHTFSLVVTNNPHISADGYVANSPRGLEDVTIGFSITREWNL